MALKICGVNVEEMMRNGKIKGHHVVAKIYGVSCSKRDGAQEASHADKL